MLLQSGFQSPAVKHAIAAIGALHEKLFMRADDKNFSTPQNCAFALEQCNQSIQHITKPADGKQPDLKSLLTTCILFTCFEAMQGHCEQAIAHAKQGYVLLKQYATDPQSKPCEMGAFATELDQLCLMMQRLQKQSKGLLAIEYHTVGEDTGVGDATKPVYFETLQDARIELEKMINQLAIFFLDLDLNDDFYNMVRDSPDRCPSYAAWLVAWEKAFSQLLARKQADLTPSERRGAMVLKAHHLDCEIKSKLDLSEGALGWDKFHPSFRAIVDLAEAVLKMSPRSTEAQSEGSSSSTTSNTKLCFSLGILDPLYDLCARCSDPLLRQRALDLLASQRRQDVLWGSWSAWKVGKYLLHLEEEKSNSPPPVVIRDADEGRVAEARFESDGGASRSMHRHMGSHVPRMELNPGLFTTDHGGKSRQDAAAGPASETLVGKYLDAQKKLITIESSTELESAPLLYGLDVQSQSQSASLPP